MNENQLPEKLEELETIYFENKKDWEFYPPDYRRYTKKDMEIRIKEISAGKDTFH